MPTPEETPSGICECGCGGQTKIAPVTVRRLRHFRGYPYPRLHGHSMRGKRGPETSSWKGGRYVTAEGYVKVRIDSRYVLEHRVVMQGLLGRPLESWEQVHHLNGVKDDNRPENLELWVRSQPNGVRSEGRHCPTCSCV